MYSVNGHIDWSTDLLSGQIIRIKAENIRQERTGVHASVGIHIESGADKKETLLASDEFNVTRHRERVTLANAAFGMMNTQAKEEYSEAFMKQDLMNFCVGLWDAHIQPLIATSEAGDATGKPLTFLAKPHIVEGGGTILFAPPGRGKTYTALLMAVSIDAGCSELWEVEQRKVMFINLERDKDNVIRRLGSVNLALGLDPDRKLVILQARGKSLTEIRDIVTASVEKHGIEVIFLDSISRSGTGDLTENNPANKIMDALNGMARSWLALAHTSHAKEDQIYGSIHFYAGADVVVQIMSEQGDTSLGVGLKVTKANDMGKQPITVLRYDFDDEGLRDVQHARLSDYPSMMGEEKTNLADEIEHYLLNDMSKATASHIARTLGKNRSQVSQALNKDERFVMVEQVGRDRLYGVKFKA
jgi:hypothetical protein